MNEPRDSAKLDDIASDIVNSLQKNTVTESDLVQLIELCGGLVNLQTISDYARHNNLSYNGVKNYRQVKEIFNVKFVIETI